MSDVSTCIRDRRVTRLETELVGEAAAPVLPASVGADARSSVSLDGTWGFHPSADRPTAAQVSALAQVSVPALWQSQGWLEHRGAAWCLRAFHLAAVDGHWTLHFGAVMGRAEVLLNGHSVGTHDGDFTPFSFDVTPYVRAGSNEVAVRIVAGGGDVLEHSRTPHGKQGWKNDIYPSPPSLYMNYAGIWQSVRLERHSWATIRDVFVDIRKERAAVCVTLDTAAALRGSLEVQIGRWQVRVPVEGSPEALRAGVAIPIDVAHLQAWSPAQPTLHAAVVRLRVDDTVLDCTTTRFGVRTIEARGDQLLLNGEPVRVRAALVQGFRPDTLYADGDRAQIEAEVRAAKALGFNMLRLHIKAFAPAYLDICDELGMLLHCDLPIAEPIAVDELDDVGPLARACVAAVSDQVRRDRNHPSVVLWSAMNEIGADPIHAGVRFTAGYERFVRLIYRTIEELDGSRLIIENDFVEPDPAYVFRSPILTAHWYGRLSQKYLDAVAALADSPADHSKVLLVTEFGDWALPSVIPSSASGSPPFWWPRDLEADLADLPWPGTSEEFAQGTHLYKGISDRLQIELFRRLPGIAGWCLTQLTDVPLEFNGVWDFERREKSGVTLELAQATRSTATTVVHLSETSAPDGEPSAPLLGAWNGWTGERIALSLVVCHDVPTIESSRVELSFVDAAGVRGPTVARSAFELTAPGPTAAALVHTPLPAAAGAHELLVSSSSDITAPCTSRYRVHVFDRVRQRVDVEVIGSSRDSRAVQAGGGVPASGGVLVVGEEGLTASNQPLVDAALAGGRTVLLLAQSVASAAHLPTPSVMVDLRTEWGSLPFVFSTDDGCLTALPGPAVVTTELLSVAPDVVYASLGGTAWPDHLTLGLYKPQPDKLTGTVLGWSAVGPGRLWVCQLPLVAAVLRDDATATVTLADVLRAAARSQGDGPAS
jgi:hypothetical protein